MLELPFLGGPRGDEARSTPTAAGKEADDNSL